MSSELGIKTSDAYIERLEQELNNIGGRIERLTEEVLDMKVEIEQAGNSQLTIQTCPPKPSA
jgi:SMC interacting uncharacterized protein involved in chromosome segregation